MAELSEVAAMEFPVVSTASAKNAARAASDVTGVSKALLKTLNLLDQVQTAGKDPSRMRVNGRRAEKRQGKKWLES